MLDKKYQEAVATPLSPVSITRKTKEYIRNHPLMHRGSVRVFTGLIYTDDEYARDRKKVVAKKWP